ncbi:hypothetical protein PRUPE_6G064800 [Prunus persica]|uniref:RING-type domain-containing protein n=1 Tax=Prunus persica TaxID=3760 RepID=A0A251NL38_PRUPE|nr:uncharacterized protein LOC18772151 [Prunus persica]ONI00047.1 hypothetical protein PRUPE_6G064800 [Prunus persica]
MGFDNECILSIQSLAGEYFCPVCRLLVYPNEALQSQCTHLYCKPCLTYVVSSTRACPYDGYLVTEADAKPLIESNKSLAETIGKIAVHCLYHRSGCTWQGPLSDCTSHCSGCAFGNSPVVCNRCGIQIVHRQVQEHAQNCPGVQPQAQQVEGALDTSASGTSATADQTQAATQSGLATSQAQVSQTTSVTAPGPDPNQKANSSSQAVVQAAVPSAEQWYQHQQQYQQYYQQYPGYDPYQQQYQNYYPYQQPAVSQSQQQHLQSHPPYGTVQHQSQTYLQSQPQTQPPLQPQLSQSQAQAQPQPQIQPQHLQAPVAAQTQNQAQVNQQQQLHPVVQTYPAAHGQPHPQPLPYFQAPSHSQPHPQHVQMPHNQQAQIQQHTQSQLLPQQHPISQPQPHSQPQQQAQLQQHPQPNPQLHPSQPMNGTIQPQTLHPSSHAVTGNHLYLQPHLHQPVQSGAPQQHTMHLQSHGMPHSQSQTPVQIQSQFPQQPPLMRPPPSHTTVPNQQQPALLPSPGQIQNINPAQQQPVHSYGHPPGNTVHQRPHMQAVQQPIPQQYFHHQPFVQQQPPTQLRPQGQSHSFPQHIHASTQSQQNVTLSQGIQHTQSNLGGRPMMPIHGVQSQTYAQTAGGVYMRPMHPAANLSSTNQNNMVRTNNLGQSGANSGPTTSERQAEQESEFSAQQNAKKVVHDVGTASAVVADAEVKTAKSETDMKSIDNENKPTGEDKTIQGDTSSKEIPDIHALENGESVSKSILKEEGVDGTLDHSSNGKLGEVVAEGVKDVSISDMKQRELKEIPSEEAQLREEQGWMLQKDASGDPQPFIGTDEGSQAVSTSAPISDQGKHLPHHGPTTLPQRPGAPLLLQVPPGPPCHTQGPGHHLRPPGPAHVPGQPFHSSEHFQPHGGNLGFGASSGRASQYGPQGSIELQSVTPHGPYNEGHLPLPPTSAFDSHGGMMSRAAPIGQPSGIHPNMLRMNGTPGLDSSSTHGPRDERFKAFPGERLNPFPVDPTRHVIDRVEFEDDLKQFPRPSYLDSEPVAKFGNYSSRPFDRAPHGFKYDSGPHTDPLAGTAPSRFLSPYRLGGSVHGNDAGDFGRMEPTHGHPDFVGRRLVDGLAPRSPVRDYPGLPPHGFRGFGPDDFDGREFHRFGDPLGNQFHEGRFSNLPGHFRRGEFEGPGNLRMVDHRRNDFIGQDGHPGHLRRGDHLGPHNLREPLGFGSRHSHMGDMAGPGNFEPFRGNRPNHPRLGEPGFRSSFSLQRFPNDGTYTGDLESFDHSRKRKPASMGWCRICKVDCETVEGLDLHSQTREHQKMAMDMVRSIKQNAKKQKLTSGDQSLLEDANKSKIPVLRAGEKSID